MEINNKIMKTIEELAEEYCVKNIPNLKDMHLTISTAFEAGFEKSQEWISVDDELPEEYQVVIVRTIYVNDYHICEAHKNGIFMECKGTTIRGRSTRTRYLQVTDVTHWRPIEYK